jgi:hypothetical protein
MGGAMNDPRKRPGLVVVVAMLAVGCARAPTPSAADAGVDGDAGTDVFKGTLAPPALDPRALGAFDLSGVTVTAFSQSGVGGRDPQVLALRPDLVPRAWAQWDRSGLQAGDYAFDYVGACQAQGTRFIGGLTASVLFADELSAAGFADSVGRNAAGQPVPHGEIVPNAYRGSLASPTFRQLLVDIAKLQIDGGVDGLFFDEVNASYTGAGYDGNEGFDDHHVADFGRYLCRRYGSAGLGGFGLVPADRLDCAAADPGAAFDYRGYLARHAVQSVPLSAANPLAVAWGSTVQNRPDPTRDTFVETYSSLVYWQEIVVAARSYARERYGKEIAITANGVFPFVDVQSVGLYDWNKDGAGPRGFDYVPLAGSSPNAHLDGTLSFLPVFQSLKDRSKRIMEATGGHEVPLLLFLDWPTDNMNRYYALSAQERGDYLRLRMAEAYALGMWFALPLATTTDASTATALGMMDLFAGLRDFYRAHADLVRAGHDSPIVPELSVAGVAAHVVGFDDGRTVVHLINHDYAAGFVPKPALTVVLALPAAPASVVLASPDLSADQPLAFTYADGRLSLTIDTLVASAMVVVR